MKTHAENLGDFFSDSGKTVILPIDHGSAIPVGDMTELGDLIGSLSSHVDGWVVNLGAARAFADQLKGSGVCLRTDVYNPNLAAGSVPVFGAEQALEVGASAMMNMLYPGHDFDEEIMEGCCEVISGGLETGVPVIVETLPRGLGLPDEYTVDAVAFAARQAAELGADVVKTAFSPGASADDYRRVVDGCFVPLIILGGAAMGDDAALLDMVAKADEAGAKGVAIGRNVWQHREPTKIASAIAAIVHGGDSAETAAKLLA